jgi:hypothetical protein
MWVKVQEYLQGVFGSFAMITPYEVSVGTLMEFNYLSYSVLPLIYMRVKSYKPQWEICLRIPPLSQSLTYCVCVHPEESGTRVAREMQTHSVDSGDSHP